ALDRLRRPPGQPPGRDRGRGRPGLGRRRAPLRHRPRRRRGPGQPHRAGRPRVLAGPHAAGAGRAGRPGGGRRPRRRRGRPLPRARHPPARRAHRRPAPPPPGGGGTTAPRAARARRVSAAPGARQNRHRGPGRAELATLALITLAGAALRARYLSQPMRYDEAVTHLAYASQPPAKGLARYDYPNNHLLHTLLVHVTTTVFGNHPWSLRLPAYTAGVALVPAWWWAVRGLYPGAAGLLTAGLVAGSSPLVEFSTNARGYMLVALDCALLVGASTALLRRATPLRWAGLAALIALALWTIPVALFPVGAVAAWLGVEALARRPPGGRQRFLAGLALALVGAGCVTVVLYLPVLRGWGVDAVVGNRFVAPLGEEVLLRRLPGSLEGTWRLAVRDAPRALVLVLLIGVALGLLGHRRLGAQRVPLLPVAAIWCGGLGVVPRGRP